MKHGARMLMLAHTNDLKVRWFRDRADLPPANAAPTHQARAAYATRGEGDQQKLVWVAMKLTGKILMRTSGRIVLRGVDNEQANELSVALPPGCSL